MININKNIRKPIHFNKCIKNKTIRLINKFELFNLYVYKDEDKEQNCRNKSAVIEYKGLFYNAGCSVGTILNNIRSINIDYINNFILNFNKGVNYDATTI